MHIERALSNISRRLLSILGRLLAFGMAEGKVRADVDPDFFCTVFLAGANALMRAETLDRFRLHPAEMARRLAKLLLAGVAVPPAAQAIRMHPP